MSNGRYTYQVDLTELAESDTPEYGGYGGYGTFEFDNDLVCDVVYLYEFEDLPPVFRRYVIYKASGRAATQLIANADLVKLLATQEAFARAACIEYETQQGNHLLLGFTVYLVFQSYLSWRALAR